MPWTGEETQVELPFDDIADAKLVLTDELLAWRRNGPSRGS
jgi:hypothetical protein